MKRRIAANIAKRFIWRLCIGRLELKAAMRLCPEAQKRNVGYLRYSIV
jgi:hypothetical protein